MTSQDLASTEAHLFSAAVNNSSLLSKLLKEKVLWSEGPTFNSSYKKGSRNLPAYTFAKLPSTLMFRLHHYEYLLHASSLMNFMVSFFQFSRIFKGVQSKNLVEAQWNKAKNSAEIKIEI
ncbi:unnamed protein product [Blepharisma stoltei]|uniref:Uncharacterized protein n=1 Tax=Blepharisma stoltei TaxID=1481888 RepID=A0AAU9JLS9_9CILI|nr:unnamed protein product [Blepharisma stoltei]